jgi:hypothetical protein
VPPPTLPHGETPMKTLAIALAAALLSSSGTAIAQSANDVQCLIVSNAFASSTTDDNQKKAAEAAVYFYLGRVGDRTTSAQLKTLLDAQSKTITDKTAGTTMNNCVHAIEAKVQLLQSLAGPAPAAKPSQPQPQTQQPQGR